MSTDCAVCVIGSGAGGGPVAYALAQAGHSVIVLERGPYLKESDLFKDEIAASRRNVYEPDRRDFPHVIETQSDDDTWTARSTAGTGWDFWNGSLVGGASNLMSGFFHRLKPHDFRLRSTFGPIADANLADWPISYDDLEPWYALVETIVGISGKAENHALADRRSTPDFPFPPLREHPLATSFDTVCGQLGLHPLRVPRAILPLPSGQRSGCSMTGFCAEYGCATGAKGSARAALLEPAIATGRCEVRAQAMVRKLVTDEQGRISYVEYLDQEGQVRRLNARAYVLACQPVETARLLLLSTGPRYPHGLANKHGQVGRNLIFSTAAWAKVALLRGDHLSEAALHSREPWLNRSLQDWYQYQDPTTGRLTKGGTIEFMLEHPNPISRAVSAAFSGDRPLFGKALKRKLEESFLASKHLVCEVFADWLPNDDCSVTLDPEVKDKWGIPVARVRINSHPQNKRVADFLLREGERVFDAMGGQDVIRSSRGAPSTNLVGGTCRFGASATNSVLDRDCRTHEVANLYVTDGSFMPTGGSVPFTWTIYANSFRVAEAIKRSL